MAYTTEQIERLEALLASGELSIRYGDEAVTYQSREDLVATIALMKRETLPKARRYTHGVIRFRRDV